VSKVDLVVGRRDAADTMYENVRCQNAPGIRDWRARAPGAAYADIGNVNTSMPRVLSNLHYAGALLSLVLQLSILSRSANQIRRPLANLTTSFNFTDRKITLFDGAKEIVLSSNSETLLLRIVVLGPYSTRNVYIIFFLFGKVRRG